jgi:hypothetical protein
VISIPAPGENRDSIDIMDDLVNKVIARRAATPGDLLPVEALEEMLLHSRQIYDIIHGIMAARLRYTPAKMDQLRDMRARCVAVRGLTPLVEALDWVIKAQEELT